jgi:hypothetical protein
LAHRGHPRCQQPVGGATQAGRLAGSAVHHLIVSLTGELRRSAPSGHRFPGDDMPRHYVAGATDEWAQDSRQDRSIHDV